MFFAPAPRGMRTLCTGAEKTVSAVTVTCAEPSSLTVTSVVRLEISASAAKTVPVSSSTHAMTPKTMHTARRTAIPSPF